MWGMRKNPSGWTQPQTNAMHWLQRSSLKSARAWRLKKALREVYARAGASNDARLARADLNAWLSGVRCSRLEPFKKLARTITERADAVVRGMTDNRSNAFVEAMNGLLQQVKRAARGFRTARNFIAIAYLRMSKLKHLPAHPFAVAAPKSMTPGRALRLTAAPPSTGGWDIGIGSTSEITQTGSNVPAAGAGSTFVLTCSRRHLNRRLALMPPFIAIAATDAPGTKLCAIRPSFNSRSCHRRGRVEPLT